VRHLIHNVIRKVQILDELHSGHRKRLRKRFLTEGMDGFEDHVVLELLLFYALPRVDTNPVAHKLLKRFGSLSAVFDASFEELCEVDGIGESAATLIMMLPAAARRYQCDKTNKTSALDTIEKIGGFMLPYFIGRNGETVMGLFLDKKRRLLKVQKLAEGGPAQTTLDIRRIIESALNTKSTSVVIAHNHARGDVVASAQDIKMTKQVSQALEQISVDLVDHIIVSGNEFYSLREGIIYCAADRAL
jgi:DNA repair protein RadC